MVRVIVVLVMDGKGTDLALGRAVMGQSGVFLCLCVLYYLEVCEYTQWKSSVKGTCEWM